MSAFTDYAGAILLAQPASPIWTRPTEWLTLPTIAAGTDRTLILHAVVNGAANRVALAAEGAYTVDWGDGTAPVNVASGVQAEYAYTYSTPALAASQMADGTRQAIISITPQAGQSITKLDLHRRHSAAPVGYYASGAMDAVVSGPAMTVLRFGRTDAGTSIKLVDFAALRTVTLTIPLVSDVTRLLQALTSLRVIAGMTLGSVTDASYMLYNCTSLQSLPAAMTLDSVTNASYMLYNCSSLQSLPAAMTLGSVTNASYMLLGCASLQSLPAAMTLGSVTNASYMLFNCSSLQSLPAAMTLGSVTNASYMLHNCSSLQSLPAAMTLGSVTNASYMLLGCASLQSLPAAMTLGSVTNASSMLHNCTSLQSLPAAMTLDSVTNASSMLYNCSSLQSAPGLAVPVSFSIASCNFSASALDAIYTSLPTVSGQTITVTGNPGTSSDTPSIATGKGWTVAGS